MKLGANFTAVTLAVLVSCAVLVPGCGGDDEKVYIALQSDFYPYMSWQSFDNGQAMSTGHPVGEEWLFRNEQPKHGSYPVGSILVKEIQVMPVQTSWQLFAMAKRGGDYNNGPGGALNWEFFTLGFDDTGALMILTRGSNPMDTDSSGHGYGIAVDGVTCNRCHGVPGTEATDHVLDDKLKP